jgi:hypothetical protein
MIEITPCAREWRSGLAPCVRDPARGRAHGGEHALAVDARLPHALLQRLQVFDEHVGVLPTSAPSYLFVTVRSMGGERVDVIELATGLRIDTNPFDPGVQSIPVAGARTLAHYFRQ